MSKRLIQKVHSIKTKSTLFALAAIASVGSITLIADSAIDELLKLTELETVSRVTHHHMALDMMHDAVRGDVYSIMSAKHSETGNAVIESGRSSLAKHIDAMQRNLVSVKATHPSDTIIRQYEVLDVAFHEYQAAALRVSQGLTSQGSHSDIDISDELRVFEAKFTEVEELMAKTSAEIQAWARDIKNHGEATARTVRHNLQTGLAISMVLSLLLPFYIRVFLVRGIARLDDAAQQLALENYATDIPHTSRADEIGGLARSLIALRTKATEAFMLKRMVDDMPICVLTAQARQQHVVNYANSSCRQMLQTLRAHVPLPSQAITGVALEDVFARHPDMLEMLAHRQQTPRQQQVRIGDQVLLVTTSPINDSHGEYVGPMVSWTLVTDRVNLAGMFEKSIGTMSQDIAGTAEKLNESATALQSAIEELSTTAADISRRITSSINVVRKADVKGADAHESMQRLSISANKVAGVVTLIQQIAEKINLLALNATIESARAGEAGKGFAVVASEVKNLATQTASAITDINAQIQDMVVSSLTAGDFVKEIIDINADISQFITDTATAVEQQQASTATIAKNICGLRNDQSAASFNSMTSLADKLATVSNELRQHCRHFMDALHKM